MKEARILIYDIETSPVLGWAWGNYEQNLLKIEKDFIVMCFAYKWLGEKKIHYVGIDSFPLPKPFIVGDTKYYLEDKPVIDVLYNLYSEADAVVAHNGDRFDQKKSRARMLFNGCPPANNFMEIDTKKEAKKVFGFTSNKLDDLGERMGFGKKFRHSGIDTWFDYMQQKPKTIREMRKYNKRDVDLLEKVYLKLRPHMRKHPNMALLQGQPRTCPRCNGIKLVRNGYKHTNQGRRQVYRCMTPNKNGKICGYQPSFRLMDKDLEKPDFI